MVLSTKFHAIRALKYLPVQLLQRLLAPHHDALRGLGLEPAHADSERLLALRERLPETLVALAFDLNALSGGRALWGLRAAAARANITLLEGVLPIVTAAHALLEKPELRRELLVGTAADDMPRFRELIGSGSQPPRPVDLGDAGRRLKALFLTRAIAPHCEIQSCNEGDLRYFLVRYAPWKSAEHEMDGERVDTREQWPVVNDPIVLDARTGRLRLGVSDVGLRSLYASFFGQLLFGEPDWFRRGEIVHLQPLERPSQDFLLPTHGLHVVRFCGVELAYEGHKSGQIRAMGEDVRPLMGILLGVPGINRLLAARFAFLASEQTSWQHIELRAPDIVSSNAPDAELARRFLEERGLLVR